MCSEPVPFGPSLDGGFNHPCFDHRQSVRHEPGPLLDTRELQYVFTTPLPCLGPSFCFWGPPFAQGSARGESSSVVALMYTNSQCLPRRTWRRAVRCIHERSESRSRGRNNHCDVWRVLVARPFVFLTKCTRRSPKDLLESHDRTSASRLASP